MLINKINLNNNKMPEKAWIRSNVAFLLFFSLSMVAILILFKPTITGFIGADTQNLPVSALVTQNTSYILSAKNSSAPVELNSLMISGKVIGDGDVKVYMLKEDRTKLLVYSNEESGWPSFITGFVKGGNQEKKQEQQEKKEERDEKKEEHQEAVEEKKEEIAEAHEEHQEAVEEKKEEIAEAHEEHQEAVEEKKEAKEEKAGEKQEKKEEKTKKREQQKQEEKKIKAEEKQEIKRIKEEQKRIEKEQKDIQKIKQTQFTFMPEQEFEANQEISIQDQINDYISSQEQINSIINSTDEQNISLFRYECYDTCFLTPDNSSTHKFIFDIEPGTILIIDEISYSSYVK